jgi:hypothetical protein
METRKKPEQPGPSWPEKGFATLEDARAWVESFVSWYNEMPESMRIA